MSNEESTSLDFICPICKQEVVEDDADNVTFDGSNNQFYHIKCLKENEISK